MNKLLKATQKHYILVFIIVLGFYLRTINLDQSLWLDEAVNVIAARSNDLFDFITKYIVADFHPPGYFVILWIWGRLFGFSETAVRLPSVLFGVGTVCLTYLSGNKLFNRKTGLTAALFLALAPLHIYYSQEARMYSLAAFSATLCMYGYIKLLKQENWGRFVYIAGSVLTIYSDYLAYFIFPAQMIYILAYKRNMLYGYLKSMLFIILFGLPWLVVFPEQYFNGTLTSEVLSGWGQVVGSPGLKSLLLLPLKILFGRINIDLNINYIFPVLFLALPVFFSLINLKNHFREERYQLLLFWLLIPLAIAYLISFYIPVFSYFRLLFILPAFYLLLSGLILKYEFNLKVLLVVLVIAGELITAMVYLSKPENHREDWRSAVSFTESKINDTTAVVFEYTEIPAPYIYYQNNTGNKFNGVINAPAKTKADINDFGQKLSGKSEIYLFEYLVDIYDPDRLAESELNRLGYKKMDTSDYRGVGFVYHYHRN